MDNNKKHIRKPFDTILEVDTFKLQLALEEKKITQYEKEFITGSFKDGIYYPTEKRDKVLQRVYPKLYEGTIYERKIRPEEADVAATESSYPYSYTYKYEYIPDPDEPT